jgi:hypothetical protein
MVLLLLAVLMKGNGSGSRSEAPFFFSLQRSWLLPFLQWCCSGMGEAEKKRRSLAVFVCLYFPPSVSKLPRFLPFSFSISFPLFLTSHSGYLHFKLLSPFSFKRALSRPKNPPPAAGVESSIYRLEGRGLLLRVGSRGAACWSARQGAWGFRFGHCSMF